MKDFLRLELIAQCIIRSTLKSKENNTLAFPLGQICQTLFQESKTSNKITWKVWGKVSYKKSKSGKLKIYNEFLQFLDGTSDLCSSRFYSNHL